MNDVFFPSVPNSRLLQRSDISELQLPMNRMLMGANLNGYDVTDAVGSVSENSLQGDASHLSQEQVTKMTSTLSKMQIASSAKDQRMEMKSNPLGINEVLSTPPTTPKRSNEESIVKPTNIKIDENANYASPNAIKKPIEIPAKVTVVSSPPPPIPPPKKMKQNFKPSVQAIQAKINVIIVHVENHQTVFVVPHCMVDDWKQLIEKTNQYAKGAENLPKPPEVGYIVLVKPKTSDKYCRALVKRIRVQSEIALVEFMEYGFTETVQFSDLKCLSEELVNAPRLVNKISLQGIPEEMENADEVIRYLMTLQENQSELIVKQLDPIEKSNVSVHFRATLVDTVKFNVINETLKSLVTVEKQNEKIEFDLIDIPPEPPRAPNRRVSNLTVVHIWHE